MVFYHNGEKHLKVLGTRYGTWWPWYRQLEVGWLHPLQLCAWLSTLAPVLVSQDRDLCHVQLHPTWFHKIEISAMYSYIPLDLNQLLNIWVDQVPSHTPVRACVKKAYTDAKAAFIDILTNQQSVALRDIWTSHSTESYLTLTCHFKTDTFDMRSQVLHTGGHCSRRHQSKWLVGLDLFDDDTRPSRHISHPAQVDVPQSCAHFPNKLLKSHYIVQVWGPVEINKLHHIR